MLPYVHPHIPYHWTLTLILCAERVRSDPPEAHWPGQGCPRRGQEEEGFIHEALEESHDGTTGSWNDYFGVGMKTQCGLLYLERKLRVTRHRRFIPLTAWGSCLCNKAIASLHDRNPLKCARHDHVPRPCLLWYPNAALFTSQCARQIHPCWTCSYTLAMITRSSIDHCNPTDVHEKNTYLT